MAQEDARGEADAHTRAPVAPVIVKKITLEEAGHHGGAWKVAYADFVTAMMAFFLLLWLLGSTTEDQRKGLADYFTPTLVKIREESAGADGLLGGSSITDADKYPNRMGQTGTRTITIPRSASGGPRDAGQKNLEDPAIRQTELKQRIERRIGENARVRKLLKQVRVNLTPEGVRIDLIDDADFSMFVLGTTVLVPEARDLVAVIAQTLSEGSSRVIVRGHTDSLPWKAGSVANNWSLSAGRAESTRQALVRGGVGPGRFLRIEGVASNEPLVADSPADPRNRRMSILLLDGS